MRDEINNVLEKYASIQVNLASESARDMIAEEICDIFAKKQTRSSKEPVLLAELIRASERK